MSDAPTLPFQFERKSEDEMRRRVSALFDDLSARRSVRHFSSEAIPLDVVRTAIHAAGQAPSGANKQPWTFVLVTKAETKRAIRDKAEAEEKAFYDGRASSEWLEDLEPLGTDARKPFLEDAPVLIVVFAQTQAVDGGKHYFVKESVGIACGMLIAALQVAGLATLTHTPSPMAFLSQILERPDNEKPFLLIPVGYPADDCRVPAIERKSLAELLIER